MIPSSQYHNRWKVFRLLTLLYFMKGNQNGCIGNSTTQRSNSIKRS